MTVATQSSSGHRTMAGAIASTLGEALANDASVVLLGESAREGGVAGTTRGLHPRFGDDRVLDVPIADRAAVGLALGLAVAGRRPIVELTATSRLLAVLEPLAEAAALARAGEFAAPLIVRVPYGTEAGPRVDAPVLDALAGIDGLTVVCAASASMAAGLLRSACRARGPVVVLEPRLAYSDRGPAGEGSFPLGTARVLREGKDVTLVGWGTAVSAIEAAAELLREQGVDADCIDCVSLAPIDSSVLSARLRETGRLVVAAPADAAFAARLGRVALAEAFEYLEAPVAEVDASPAAIVAAALTAVQF